MDHCYDENPRVHRGDLELLPDADLINLARVAKALNDPIRLQIINLLGQREDLCTCEFEEILGLGQSKVSYHLNILLEVGLVTRQLHGTWSHYSLRNHGILDQIKKLIS